MTNRDRIATCLYKEMQDGVGDVALIAILAKYLDVTGVDANSLRLYIQAEDVSHSVHSVDLS